MTARHSRRRHQPSRGETRTQWRCSALPLTAPERTRSSKSLHYIERRRRRRRRRNRCSLARLLCLIILPNGGKERTDADGRKCICRKGPRREQRGDRRDRRTGEGKKQTRLSLRFVSPSVRPSVRRYASLFNFNFHSGPARLGENERPSLIATGSGLSGLQSGGPSKEPLLPK